MDVGEDFSRYQKIFHGLVIGVLYDYSCYLAKQCVERMVDEANKQNTVLTNKDVDDILIASFLQMRGFMSDFDIPHEIEPYHQWHQVFSNKTI